MKKLRLDVWSDIVCPWCYIGKRHLEQALATFAHAGDVEIVWRAFELDPNAPRVRERAPNAADRIAKKYRISTVEAQAMVDRVVGAGTRAGLAFRYDELQSGNTFDGHRLLHWALEVGKQGALKERLFAAYMTEGQAIGEPEVLATLAGEVGLDATEARAILAGDRYADAVRADESLARELGITGVPFFVMAGRIGVSGAQPAETLASMLDKAWSELGAETYAEGAACGPDGC